MNKNVRGSILRFSAALLLLGTSGAVNAQKVVVNKIYNHSSTVDGLSDAVELLVVAPVADLRNLVIKDFESNITSDAGGKYRFKEVALWESLKAGTTIVIRRTKGLVSNYTEDVDPSDLRLDLLMENTAFFDNLTTTGGFNITQVDMVMIKTGSGEGVDGAIHTFATGNGGAGGVPSSLFLSVPGKKLVSSANTTNPRFQYPLMPTKSLADYDGAKAALAGSGVDRAWGEGYSLENKEFIQSLRAFSQPFSSPNSDAVELLVVKDKMDMRGLVFKDFSGAITSDNGGKYRFNADLFWSSLRSGTTIVLRSNRPYVNYTEDTDPSDFTLDLLLENTAYFTNEAEDAANERFDINETDMVMLKSGSAKGVEGAIHTFASNSGGGETPTPLFNSVQSGTILTSPEIILDQHFQYPLAPAINISDYSGNKAALSETGANADWGQGFSDNNKSYIQQLRAAVLPVKLASFKAEPGLGRVTLSWATAAENGNSHFEVYRSPGDNTFQVIGTVAGKGNSLVLRNYSFIDYQPSYGVNYYMLKQVDMNGNSENSNILQVRFEEQADASFSVFINRENSQLNLDYFSSIATNATFSITDLAGRRISAVKVSLQQGRNQLNLGSVSLQPGVYVGSIHSSAEKHSVKFTF